MVEAKFVSLVSEIDKQRRRFFENFLRLFCPGYTVDSSQKQSEVRAIAFSWSFSNQGRRPLGSKSRSTSKGCYSGLDPIISCPLSGSACYAIGLWTGPRGRLFCKSNRRKALRWSPSPLPVFPSDVARRLPFYF